MALLKYVSTNLLRDSIAALRGAAGVDWLSWHYRLGLVTCVGILLWGLSGLSHPLMSRLQPKPVAFTAPAQALDLQQAQTPGTVLTAYGIQRLQRLAVITLDGKAYFRVSTDSQKPARYFALADGQELADGDARYARALASHYTGLPLQSITEARFVTAFSDDYHGVNRLLPVWRVAFSGNDGLRAFVDTDQARLATLVDDRRYMLTRLFRFGHNWAFADSMPSLQLGLMASVLAIALLSAGSGLYLYAQRRRQAAQYPPLRRWHRRLGLLVALSTMLFTGSGMFHLFMSFQQERTAQASFSPEILTTQLANRSWQQLSEHTANRLDLVSDGQHPFWLLQQVPARSQVAALANAHTHHDHAHHARPGLQLLPADEGTAVLTDAMLITQHWAATYARRSPGDIHRVEMISRFGGEYGFVFKRLPVVKVQFTGPGNPRYYIELATGALAAKVTDLDAAEGWTFAYLHKWNFAEANKDVRDALVMLFALGNIVVALLGLVMFARRPTTPLRRRAGTAAPRHIGQA